MVSFASAVLLSSLTLASGGSSDYAIVRPDKAPEAIAEWAKFLSTTLHEMTGAEFPVVGASERKAGSPAILFAVRPEGTKFEEYVLRTEGRDIVLTGFGQRGPALAARHFLTRVCGCRWYDGWTRKIPKVDALVIPDLNVRRTPSFFYRTIFCGGGWGGDPKWKTPPYAKPAMPGTAIGHPGDAHTLYAYSSGWPVEEHPELLSMTPDGQRRKLTGAMGPNFCFTNPLARQLARKRLREFIEMDRADARKRAVEPPFVYVVCINDCSNYLCHCPDCDKFAAKHNESGLMLDFINDLARDIAKDYPEVLVETDAYSYVEPPPKGDMKAEPNVLVEVTRTQQNYYSPVDEDLGHPFVDYLKGWGQVVKTLSVWDYWIFYWDAFPAPYHNVHFIRRNLQWYHDIGVRAMRLESEAPNTASFRSLKAWLGDELLLDIEQDDKPMIDEFFADFYGAAASEMRELMDLIAERQRGQDAPVFLSGALAALKYNLPPRKWLDADFYAKAEDIFARAEAKLKDADEQTRINVLRERIPVDLSLLNVYDTIKPAIGRRALADRFLANQERQLTLRVAPNELEATLHTMRSDAERLVQLDRINARKAGPKPVLEIPRAPATVVARDWPENNGLDGKGVSVEASVEAGNVLVLKFVDTALTAPPFAGFYVFDGDDWEVMLAEDRGGRYAHLIVGPKGAKHFLHEPGKPNEGIEVKGLETKSEADGKVWTLTMRIPLDALPVKDVKYGNFFRNGPGKGCGWSPTYAQSFCEPSAFGEIRFK